MANDPLVSVIIPVYNRESLIGETLDSVLTQTYQNWECIVVDDGSSDNSKGVVQQYSAKDSRIKLFERPSYHKPGGNGARNFGLEVSKGEFIQWLDSDDLLHPQKIEYNLSKLGDRDKYVICFSQYYRFMDSLDKLLIGSTINFQDYKNPMDYIKQYCLKGNGICSCSLFVNREIIKLSGGWDESVLKNQDGEFIMRIIINATELIFDDVSIAYYRMNPLGKRESFEKGNGIEDFRTVKKIIKTVKSLEKNDELNIYFATLLNHLKFEYPNSKRLWLLIDNEIDRYGGEFLYSMENKKFKILWRIFGLRKALRIFQIKKGIKNIVAIILK
jgi:glycosyltransferase involved in cell wall biosynthesis